MYFDPGMAGVDWAAMRAKYEVLLPRVATRHELNDLIGEMVAELSLGHTYVWGGDARGSRHIPVGLLGADLKGQRVKEPITARHARSKHGCRQP